MVRFLLLQVRKSTDPMREQEVRCFADSLQCDLKQIQTLDLITTTLDAVMLELVDIVLIGGSGDFSVTKQYPWQDRALEGLRLLYQTGQPTFASCWGFQALAKALGGTVENDVSRAEVGTLTATLTRDGRRDPVFGDLPATFSAQMGHEDHVTRLPPGAILLATNDRVENQAFSFADKPIYATQFHPELNAEALLDRVRAYPKYIEELTGLSLKEFSAKCHDTPEVAGLLPKFVSHVCHAE